MVVCCGVVCCCVVLGGMVPLLLVVLVVVGAGVVVAFLNGMKVDLARDLGWCFLSGLRALKLIFISPGISLGVVSLALGAAVVLGLCLLIVGTLILGGRVVVGAVGGVGVLKTGRCDLFLVLSKSPRIL